MERLGERVKKRREALRIGQKQVAEEISASVSMLSQIENGRAFPSILTLKKIAEALDTTVGDLIGEQENLNINPVLLMGNEKFVKKNKFGTSLYLLSNHDQGKQMEPYKIKIKPEGHTEGLLVKHPGQSYCYILKGKVTFHIGHKKYNLKCGDNIYFMSNIEHKIINESDDDAEIIWVVTPTTLQ